MLVFAFEFALGDFAKIRLDVAELEGAGYSGSKQVPDSSLNVMGVEAD